MHVILERIIRVMLFLLFVTSLGWIAFVNARFGGKRLSTVGIAVVVMFVNLLALAGLVLVIAPRVPDAAKDGLFGGTAGLMGGAFLLSSSLAWAILGEAIGIKMHKRSGHEEGHSHGKN